MGEIRAAAVAALALAGGLAAAGLESREPLLALLLLPAALLVAGSPLRPWTGSPTSRVSQDGGGPSDHVRPRLVATSAWAFSLATVLVLGAELVGVPRDALREVPLALAVVLPVALVVGALGRAAGGRPWARAGAVVVAVPAALLAGLATLLALTVPVVELAPQGGGVLLDAVYVGGASAVATAVLAGVALLVPRAEVAAGSAEAAPAAPVGQVGRQDVPPVAARLQVRRARPVDVG